MIRIAALVAFLAASASPAAAAIVAFDFTAEVLLVNPLFESIVSVGSPASGRLTYDTEAVDTNANVHLGAYPGATLTFTMGSYAYSGAGTMYVYDEDTFDGFLFAGQTAGGDPIDGLPLAQVNVDFIAEPTLYASDALPAAPPALDDPLLTDPSLLRIGVLPPGQGISYQSARLLTLPEADGVAAALGASTALAALAGRRARAGRRVRVR